MNVFVKTEATAKTSSLNFYFQNAMILVTPHEHALSARGCSLLSCAFMAFPSWHASKRSALIIYRPILTPTTAHRLAPRSWLTHHHSN